ncbi:ProQ/FINO family protein [Pistricoccus aurantiacus]|uniref:ProQ/FINO family protein n=1 Tax=Pistricoccus aurantiacus TaxID=1883414 RepID=UPI003633C81E
MANERMNALFTSLERHARDRSLELLEARRRIARLEARNQELERHSRELLAQMTQLAEQARTTRASLAPARSKGFAALMERRPRRDLPSQTSSAPEVSTEDKATSVGESQAAAPVEPLAEPTPQPEAVIPKTATQDAPSPQGLLNQWYRRYTKTFFKGHTRPLKIGIHEELLAREPWPEKLVRRALACYVHLPRYLKAVREGSERVGLDGEAAGLVGAGEAEHARKKLEELRAKRNDAQKAAKQTDEKPVKAAKSEPAAQHHEPACATKKSRHRTRRQTSKPEAKPSEPQSFEQKLSALIAKHQK